MSVSQRLSISVYQGLRISVTWLLKTNFELSYKDKVKTDFVQAKVATQMMEIYLAFVSKTLLSLREFAECLSNL